VRTLKLQSPTVFLFFSKCTELAILKLQGSASGVVGFLIQGAVKLALEMDAERWTITRQRRVDFQWRKNNAAFVPTARRTGLALPSENDGLGDCDSPENFAWKILPLVSQHPNGLTRRRIRINIGWRLT